MKEVIIVSLILMFLMGSCVTWVNENYSEWQRTGEVYKISTKGIIFKSIEWEAYLWGAWRSMDWWVILDKFYFTLKDDSVLTQLNICEWKVNLIYDQWLIKPISQDTRYTVHTIECK